MRRGCGIVITARYGRRSSHRFQPCRFGARNVQKGGLGVTKKLGYSPLRLLIMLQTVVSPPPNNQIFPRRLEIFSPIRTIVAGIRTGNTVLMAVKCSISTTNVPSDPSSSPFNPKIM